MSRIGKLPIAIPEGVTVEVKDLTVTVKGKLGELTQEIKKEISVEIKDNEVIVSRSNDEKQSRAYHGLFRSLINKQRRHSFKRVDVSTSSIGITITINRKE